jgi:hypothetical protein
MKIRKGYTLRSLGKEFILVPEGLEAVDFTRMISLNESAAFLWKALEDKDFDNDTMIQLLMDEYDISREVAEKDVEAFLQTLKKADVVH